MNNIKQRMGNAVAAALQAGKRTMEDLLPAKKMPAVANGAADPPPKPGPDPAPTEALLAWHAPLKNTRLLVAYKPDTDPTNPTNLVSVNVRDNTRFLPHMKLRVQRAAGNTYNLVGPLPRWRGRW